MASSFSILHPTRGTVHPSPNLSISLPTPSPSSTTKSEDGPIRVLWVGKSELWDTTHGREDLILEHFSEVSRPIEELLCFLDGHSLYLPYEKQFLRHQLAVGIYCLQIRALLKADVVVMSDHDILSHVVTGVAHGAGIPVLFVHSSSSSPVPIHPFLQGMARDFNLDPDASTSSSHLVSSCSTSSFSTLCLRLRRVVSDSKPIQRSSSFVDALRLGDMIHDLLHSTNTQDVLLLNVAEKIHDSSLAPPFNNFVPFPSHSSNS